MLTIAQNDQGEGTRLTPTYVPIPDGMEYEIAQAIADVCNSGLDTNAKLQDRLNRFRAAINAGSMTDRTRASLMAILKEGRH
jgi:hypothetical protein